MSSIIRLFTNPLDAKSLIEYEIEPGTVLIDWLQDEYPEGFGSLVRVFIGKDEIDLDDLDYEVGDLEQITILVMPGGGAGAAISAAWTAYGGWSALAVQVAVAVGVGIAMALLFPPKKMDGDDGGEDPVYSLNTSTNKARLGQPIPSHYGTVNFPPDVASAPYSFFSHDGESNEQFIDGLYCLGQGKFDVDNMEVYVGDTPISQLEKGSAFYYITGAGGHYRTMGAFSEIINRKLSETAYPYPFRENIYTSPEVENFIFSESGSDDDGTTSFSLVSPTSEAISYLVEGGGTYDKYYSAQLKDIPVTLVAGEPGESIPTPNVSAGDDIIITGTANNNGTFGVTAVVQNPEDPNLMTVYIKDTFYLFNHIENEDLVSGSYKIDKSQANMSAGPFRAQKQGQLIDEVECDIIFPQGIYRISGSGNSRKRTVTWELTVTEIDPNTGDTIGVPSTTQHSITSKLRGPVRTTISSGKLPVGAYVATVRRTSNISDATDIQDQMVWSGLKGVIIPAEGWVYGYTTLLFVRLRATAGIASAARQRITVRAKRLLENDTVDSSDPIEVVRDIWTSKRYGLNRPESEMDIAALDALSAHWAANNVHFNGSFASKGTGWDAMTAALAFAGAKPVQQGGLLTVVADQVKPIRTAMFSSANIIAGSYSASYSWDTQGDYDAIQVEYRDPTTFDPAFEYYFLDTVDGLGVESFSPDTYNCFGCTDKTYASQYATYMFNVKNNRRKAITFKTEMDGLIPVFGDRILVTHPMTDLTQSGVFVEQIDATTWRVDQAIDWSKTDTMIIRNEFGAPSDPYSVSIGGAANEVVFAVEPTEIVTDSQGVEPTHWMSGASYDVSKDYTVASIRPEAENVVTITAQVYDEAIYDGAPPQMSNV